MNSKVFVLAMAVLTMAACTKKMEEKKVEKEFKAQGQMSSSKAVTFKKISTAKKK